jgi:hypothetical protein
LVYKGVLNQCLEANLTVLYGDKYVLLDIAGKYEEKHSGLIQESPGITYKDYWR